MNSISPRTIKPSGTQTVKAIMFDLFGDRRGGRTRANIMNLLYENYPMTKNQIAQKIKLDYNVIRHHIRILEKNSLVEKISEGYGACYFVSAMFESNKNIFSEIDQNV